MEDILLLNKIFPIVDMCLSCEERSKIETTRQKYSRLPFLANVNSCSRSLYAVARPSVVYLSVCRLSVTLVHPTQAVQIFGNISTALGTLAIH